jgi:SAM-dependent methyltransferase
MIPPLPNALLGDWANLDRSLLKLPADHKFLDRNMWIRNHWERLHQWLPEYLGNTDLKFGDISCGNGATLEILKFLGHPVTAMDYTVGFPPGDWIYKPLIDSQSLQCICHDGSNLPYPFADKSIDILINYGSLTFYKPVERWPQILDEFARITTTCIFLAVNVGDIYDSGKHLIENWEHPDFELKNRQNSHFKWIRKQQAG